MITFIKYIGVDEVHDISEQMIFTLMVIKEYINTFGREKGCPVFIFMSATVNIKQMFDYFGIKPTYMDAGDLQRPLDSPAKYKIDVHYFAEDKGLDQRFLACLRFLYQIYDDDKIYDRVSVPGQPMRQKDVLIICPYGPVIKQLMLVIEENPPTFPFKAMSYMSMDDAAEGDAKILFVNVYYKPVKFIFSTNMLEAGSTIPTLYVVVDTGVLFSPAPFPLSGDTELILMPISQSSKEQRIGRVGRLGDGVACCLYPEKYEFQPYDPSPMIVNKNILNRLMVVMSL